MDVQRICDHIVAWLDDYAQQSGVQGFIVGISGGIDSALTSALCALTNRKTVLVNMPIRQTKPEYERACEHIADLKKRFSNVNSFEVDLTEAFEVLERTYPKEVVANQLAMANTRARLRMTTLYALGQANGCLVAGTGNKIEDFGIGFFTKYGDGGVDLSPIADLTKTQVKVLATHLGVIESILAAKPTDGLWADGRSDEDQIGASYPELEWAMDYKGNELILSDREREVLTIFRKFNKANKHKMEPIPVCLIPKEFFD